MEQAGKMAGVRLAIVGMEAEAGPWIGLDALDAAFYRAQRACRLAGTPDPSLGLPAEIHKAIIERLTRVGKTCLESSPSRTQIGMAWFCEPPGILLQPAGLAGALGITGPVVDCSQAPDPALAALETALEWLSSGKVIQVLLLGGSFPQHTKTESDDGCWFPIARSYHAIPAGEGVAACLLERYRPSGNPNFPLISILQVDELGNLVNSFVASASSGQPVMLSFCGTDQIDSASLQKRLAGEVVAENAKSVALHSPEACLGSGAAARLSALISLSSCLKHRYIPAIPHWDGVSEVGNWERSPFFVPNETQPWIVSMGSIREAGLVWLQKDNPERFIKLVEPNPLGERPNPSLPLLDYRLFPLAASTKDELLGMMKLLRVQLQKNPDLHLLSRKWYEVYRNRPNAPLALMLTGSSVEEVNRELDFASKGVPEAFETHRDWQTPAGSCFIPSPLGSAAQVCFVYPGAFNSYIGLGRNLFRYFPQAYQWIQPVATDLPGVFCDRQLYPRSMCLLEKDELEQLEADLTLDAVAMMTSGMSFAVLYTHILRDIFKIWPVSALGYSLGENSMLFATGVWGDGDAASEALARSPLFTSQLAGPLNAVRETWGMPPQAEGRSEDIWSNHVIMAPAGRVLDALSLEDKVYLTHTNAARQVVIGGEKEACLRVIKELKSASLKAPFSYALHCRAMENVYGDFRRLNTHPVLYWPKMRLYSAAGYDTFTNDPEDIAHRVAKSLCEHLDFPRLVNLAFEDGARVFIELGAGGNCARWVDEILRGRQYLALSINRKGIDDGEALVRVLARLASHRLPVDLSMLYL